MAETKNPFDVLIETIGDAAHYEEAYKKVWTALKTGIISEDMNISILLTASSMPALAADNIRMEKMLRDNGLIQETPQTDTANDIMNTPNIHIVKTEVVN